MEDIYEDSLSIIGAAETSAAKNLDERMLGIKAPRADRKPVERELSSDCRSLVLLDDRVQVVQSLLHGQGVHFTPAIFTGLDGPPQIMSCDLDCHGIGDDPPGLPVELDPRHVRESDPNRPVADQELDVDGVSVPRRNGND